ncbi:MAG: hypothetical protein ACOCRZ_01625 [Halothermotrichaceae bacterium]
MSSQLKITLDMLKNIITQDSFKKYLKNARWFGKKASIVDDIIIKDYSSFTAAEDNHSYIVPLILSIIFKKEKEKSLYYLPVLISKQKKKAPVLGKIDDFTVYDAIHTLDYNNLFDKSIFDNREKTLEKGGRVKFHSFSENEVTSSKSLTDVSSNSLTLIEKDMIVKTYRHLDAGTNPDIEINLSLSKETDFNNFPRITGYVTYNNSQKYYLALIQNYIINKGDLWAWTEDFLDNYYRGVINKEKTYVNDHADNYYKDMKSLGSVIARLHLALADIKKELFLPESLGHNGIKLLVNNITNSFNKLITYMEDKQLTGSIKENVEKVIKSKEKILKILDYVMNFDGELGQIIRIHGDLHLEQILKTRDSFVVLDFEGEPLKSLADRRCKYSPLKDVAGMIRSFNYSGYSALFNKLNIIESAGKNYDYEEISKQLESTRKDWEQTAVNSFLESYFYEIKKSNPDLVPQGKNLDLLLAVFKLEKSIYEGLYEVNNRLEWLKIPLNGIIECLNDFEGVIDNE